MKRIITFLLLFAALKVAGQTTGYFRFDTVRIMKQNGTCELYLINKTKDTIGFLYNVGGGLTQFRRIRQITDTSFVAGVDTIRIVGTGGGGGGSTDITITHAATTNTVNSSTGTDGTINYAKTTLAGVLSPRSTDIGHLPEIKNYMAAMGLQAPNNVANYTATSIDSVYYKFSTTRMGSSGGEFGGWLTNNLTGDSVQVRAPYWVLIGDSQAEGHPGKHGRLDPNGLGGFNAAYPDSVGQLSYHLRLLTNMRWVNHGIGGNNTTQTLRRFYRDAIGKPGTYTNSDTKGNQTLWYKPQGVVIIVGINDVSQGVNPSVIMRNLEQMAAICQAEGIQCVFLNLPGDEVMTQTMARGIETINKWLSGGVMDQYGATVVDYNTWWQDPAYKDNFHASTLIADDIHPSAVGYDSLANHIFRSAHLPVLKRAIFYNELDPGGFTGYSRPTGFTIGNAPGYPPTAYTIANAIDSVTITAPVWDSVWIKTTAVTTVTGTTFSGWSSIYWYCENNIDTLRVTKRTAYNNGSQKPYMTTSKLTILPPSYLGTDPVIDIPLADYTTNPYGFRMFADGGLCWAVLNGLTTDAKINNAVLSVYGLISTNSNIIAEGTNSRIGHHQFLTGTASANTWGFGRASDGTTFGINDQSSHAGGKSTFLLNTYDQASASASTRTLGAAAGALTRFVHITPYFGNAGNTDQRTYGIFVDMTVDQTNGTHTGTQETALRLKTNLTSTTNTLVRGVLQDNGHNYWNTGSGNFAIGVTDTTNAPGAKLHVNGSVRLDIGSDATGDIWYRSSGGNLQRLGVGANGDVLTLASGEPSWAAPSGGSGITSVNSQTGPTITIAGSNGNTVSASSNTVTVSSPYTLIYSDTSQTAVSNTTTETSLLGNIIGSASIDGGTLTAGSVLVLRGYGTISVDATPANCEFDFTISNFTLGLTATGLSNSLTNAPFEYEFEVSPFALGTDQFAFYRGKIEILDGSTIKRFTGNAKYSFFTTTGSLTVDVTAQWATANSNNTVTSRNNTCEVKRRQ